MPSRISQMRNVAPMPQQQVMNQLPPEVIEQVKRMMAQVKNAPNPQAMLAQMLASNPYTGAIANMLKSNGNLEIIAKQMAQSNAIDINQLVQSLQGGF